MRELLQAPQLSPPAFKWKRTLFLALLCAVLAGSWRATQAYPTILFDLYPLYGGGQQLVESGSAFNIPSASPTDPADRTWFIQKGGNLYPLPAVLVTLPLSFLPAQVAGVVWVSLLVFSLVMVLGLWGVSPLFLLYLPFIEAIRIEQYTALAVAFELFTLWAFATKRPLPFALGLALCLTKPNQTLLFVLAFLWWGRSYWRYLLGAFALVWGVPTLLWPAWWGEWLPRLLPYATRTQDVEPVVWILALLAVPLWLWRDRISATVVGQFSALPLAGVYVASPLPMGIITSRLKWWLVAAAAWWPIVALAVGKPWATGITLVLPLIVCSWLTYRKRV